MKQTESLFYVGVKKPYHLFFKIEHACYSAKMHLYFTYNASFRRAIDKLMEVSEEWLRPGYCERSARVYGNAYNARIEIKSASVEHFKLQLACLQCWINAQDDLLANMLISQGDGENEDQG